MILSMYCPNGRVGKTTSSLAFAHEAQSVYGIETCVLEFDFSPGDISSILNVDPAKNILNAADGDYDIAIQKPLNEDFHVIVAGYPDYIEQLKSEDVVRIIEDLQSKYELVIIDIQPNFVEQVIDILQASDKIVLVMNNEEQGIIRVLKNIDWGIKSGYMDEEKFEILINKFNKRDKINYINESQMKYPLLTTIPNINNFKGYNDERFSKYMGPLITVLFPDLQNDASSHKKGGGLFASLFNRKKEKPTLIPVYENKQLPEPQNKYTDIDIRKRFGKIKENENAEDFCNDINEINKEENDMLTLSKNDMLNTSNESIFELAKECDNITENIEKIELNDDVKVEKNNNANNNHISSVEPYDFQGKSVLDVQEKSVLDVQEKSILDVQEKSILDGQGKSVLDVQEKSILDGQGKSVLDVQEMINKFVTESNFKISELTKENNKLTNKNKFLETSNELLEKKVLDIKNKNTELEINLKKADQTYRNKENELTSLQYNVESVTKELISKNECITMLNKQLLDKETEYQEKVKKIKKSIEELNFIL